MLSMIVRQPRSGGAVQAIKSPYRY